MNDAEPHPLGLQLSIGQLASLSTSLWFFLHHQPLSLASKRGSQGEKVLLGGSATLVSVLVPGNVLSSRLPGEGLLLGVRDLDDEHRVLGLTLLGIGLACAVQCCWNHPGHHSSKNKATS